MNLKENMYIIFVLQKHFKSHVYQPSPLDEDDPDEGINDSSDEYVQESSTGSETDDYDNDDISQKNSGKPPKKKKKPNSVSEETQEPVSQKPVAQKPVETKPAPVPKPSTAKIVDASSFFYKFVCEWLVLAASYGVNASENSIKCRRKFTKLKEAVDHLQNHHAEKVKACGSAIQCSWEDCPAKETVFNDIDDLKAHLVHHADGTPIPIELNNSKSTKNSGQATKAPKKDSGTTWCTASLHALLWCDIPPQHDIFCSNTCFFCRFYSLKNNINKAHLTAATLLEEFKDLIAKFTSCKDNPYEFITCFAALASDHEELHHKSETFPDIFWTEDINESDLKCDKHTDRNLMNLFPTRYKNCSVCSKNSKRWPKPEHRNLVLALDTSIHTRIDQTLFVRGREYQIKALICRDRKSGKFYTHLLDDDKTWTTFRGDKANFGKTDKVLRDKGAQIVFYSNTESQLAPKVNANIDIDIKPQLVSDPFEQTVESDLVPPTTEYPPLLSPPAEKNEKFSICTKKDFHPQYASRRLKNTNGVGSCINSVLQALLTTGLPTITKKFCPINDNCNFCQMSSAIQRTLATKEGKIVDPYELDLGKSKLGVPTDKEGNPVDYIKRLLQIIVNDEQAKHESNEVMHKFVIRFRKSCVCMKSYETYHWDLNLSKQNQSLDTLLADHSSHCGQCGTLTHIQPVQLPENLIITIEPNQSNSSLYYPGELATRFERYFLASVIVSTSGGTHYSAYCKVFGKWLHYDDEDCCEIMSGEVLYLKADIRVLVYVTKELTATDIKTAIARARELDVSRPPVVKQGPPIVKQEKDL